MSQETFGEDDKEVIQLIFIEFDEFDDVLDEIGDVKAECAWRRYKRILEKRAKNMNKESTD
jgi:hypothetical protein